MDKRLIFETTGLVAAGLLFGTGLAALSAREDPGAEVASTAIVELDVSAMEVAVGEALRTPGSLDRSLALDRALQALTLENAAGVQTAMEASLGALNHCAVGAFTDQLAEIDPAAAFDRSLHWKDPGLRRLGVQRASYHWALRGEGSAAEHAVRSVSDPETPYLAQMGMVRGWAERGDVEAATDLLMRSGENLRAYSTAVLASWLISAEGPEALIAWAEAIPADTPHRLKSEALRTALVQVASLYPLRAATFFESFEGTAHGRPMLTLLLQMWARSDPDAMLTWLRDRPITPDVKQAFGDAVRQWRVYDGPGANAWLKLQHENVLAQMGHRRKARRRVEEGGE